MASGDPAVEKTKPVLLPTPDGLVTETLPDEPLAKTAVMLVAELTVKDAAGLDPK
jgi:hypothetical protein